MANKSNSKQYYRQKFPHIQYLGDTFFVTFRLHGSIPAIELARCKRNYQDRLLDVQNKYQSEILNYSKFEIHRKHLLEIDNLLHSIRHGPTFFSNENCAQICEEQFHRFDNEFYKLLAFTIMNNHVHLLIDTSVQFEMLEFDEERITNEFQTLDRILKRIKGATAQYCNRELNRSGQFWERESYDTYIRNERMLGNIITYILNNPVKAGLIANWQEYRWNYLATNSGI
ncbi:transposase [Portibacter lacus]|uniref:Transposase IS200-like domain-containing protein n=1 Tax=Portibacter lacus TaxID=1099794 RepID=A0AA37SQ47_9BACT|nr:transposase [Portibacter lacus]GLR17512.1 hypothetical protein GCM10007940_21270 [Portibacter lacus]